ncbi:MAG: phytanoyl-CoA dioxygenase family protein, partial [Acidobacteriota bacterium]
VATAAAAAAATATNSGLFQNGTLDRRLDRDGYLVVDFLRASQLDEVRALFRAFAPRYRGAFAATLLIPDPAHRAEVHGRLAEILTPAVDAVFREVRSVFWGFINKQPDGAGAMPLHQDITMVSEKEGPGLSVWAPLVDVGVGNGGLQVVPGSHRLSSGPRAPGTPFPCPELEPQIRERHLQTLELTAGQAVVMDHGTYHASPPNTGLESRPVVAGVLAGRNQPLRYCHRLDPAAESSELDVFEVDDDFYLRHAIGLRPEGLAPIARVAEARTPIRLDELG